MAPRTVILTGAGISAESGLGTFRDKGGIWSSYDLSQVATPEGFARNPALVHEFYNLRRANMRAATANAAHHALARLQKDKPGEVLIVTQNVDDLHERAGSAPLIHMHGQLARALCAACGARWDAPEEMQATDACAACGARATRPDVVWFGEMPYRMEEIIAALGGCELFAAIGTSGQVWPAAGFVEEARGAGARCVELNLERSEVSAQFDEHRIGPASEVVPAWVAGLTGRPG
jgi:NAD-dependent deacetylase